MIIDHIGLTVGDYDESKQFFCRALEPLGIESPARPKGRWTPLTGDEYYRHPVRCTCSSAGWSIGLRRS
jgi:catechol 2,3-dioxygenase-like lactoylglutathione lyase family enzyme